MIVGNVKPVSIEAEMRSSYLDYAMSVIVSRALPDVRDGLKPVHRRILYAMNDMGISASSSHKKSARIVGEVLGKYHPHGDAPVYEAMVRMAQDFSMRYVLIDGQGNFGSMDNDPPAAMRYTEARLATIAQEMLVDIDKDTVDFTPNFDDSLVEPLVLPTRIPNLMMNGSSGIAVGMATSIPPHNLGELCDAICYLIDHQDVTVDELTRFVPGPDFPTAGIILGKDGINNAYATGHGRILVRAKATPVETTGGNHQILVTELPYQTDKSALMEKIANLVKDKKIEGISELRDESDRHGMRIVIELKRYTQPQQVLNNLYKYTSMQSAFFFNMLALVDGQPRVISLKEALQHFIDFRKQVIIRRSRYELKQAESRLHILEGLKIALDNIDRIIDIIRSSKNVESARQNLMAEFGLTQVQAQAILDMQLRRLASLERQKILDEHAEVSKTIAYLKDLLGSPSKIMELIKSDILEIKKKYAEPRRTIISEQAMLEFREEDLIPHQRVAVTLSDRGFIKRVPSRAYRVQHRGGKGIIGMVTRETDAVRLLLVGDTHDTLLFFSNLGKVYSLKCHELPHDISRIAKGTAVVNLFPVSEHEKVTAVMGLTSFLPGSYCLMATRLGEIKKTAASNFAIVRSNGLIAMDLEEGDELVDVALATEQDDIIMVTQKGQSIRFGISELRTSSRTSGGVKGIRLAPGDFVVSMDTAVADAYILVVTANGYGKLTPVSDYPHQHRAGSGVMTLKLTDKTGDVAAARLVTRSQQLMLISSEGIVTRTPVKENSADQGIPIYNRATQGVRLMRLNTGDRVVAIANFDV